MCSYLCGCWRLRNVERQMNIVEPTCCYKSICQCGCSLACLHHCCRSLSFYCTFVQFCVACPILCYSLVDARFFGASLSLILGFGMNILMPLCCYGSISNCSPLNCILGCCGGCCCSYYPKSDEELKKMAAEEGKRRRRQLIEEPIMLYN